jgi:glucosamine--fructose-6-phosphate aminotransferase (isomerizing)
MSKGIALMEAELREAPDVVARQAEFLADPLRELAALLRHTPPQVVVTCARGSSAHAANFGKYLVERYLGVPVAAVAPSITTVYRQRLRLKGQFFLTISQSGRSDDLVEAASSARNSGALTAAIVNDTSSPLASVCEIVLPMAAGQELSVAATKTFIASVAILLRLTAKWASERAIEVALDRLPDRLAAAAQLDWSRATDALSTTGSLTVLGRGPTLAIAQEASLKLKEVCNIQAEAFSGAEFQHGPIALVSKSYPVLIFMPTDEAAPNLAEVAADVSGKGASVFVTGTGDGVAGALPVLPPENPETDSLCLIQSFYGLAVRLAEHRGVNVDLPRHLQKITRTR